MSTTLILLDNSTKAKSSRANNLDMTKRSHKVLHLSEKIKLGTVAHSCNPIYLGCEIGGIMV
jgi:hypothetical protein